MRQTARHPPPHRDHSKTICSERYSDGSLWLSSELESDVAAVVRTFIRNGQFRKDVGKANILHAGRYTTLWEIDLPRCGACVLKEMRVPHDKGVFRALERSVEFRVAPPVTRALRTACALRRAGVRTFEPLAAWTDCHGKTKNFLLYRKLAGVALGDYWMGAMPFRPQKEANLSNGCLASYLSLAGQLVRNLFETGFSHADLHPKNLVVPDALDGSGPMSVLDLDSVFRIPWRFGRRVRFTTMIKSLRHIAECFCDGEDPILAAFVRSLCADNAEAESAVRRGLDHWRSWSGHSRAMATVTAFFRCPPPRRSKGAVLPWDLSLRHLPSGNHRTLPSPVLEETTRS